MIKIVTFHSHNGVKKFQPIKHSIIVCVILLEVLHHQLVVIQLAGVNVLLLDMLFQMTETQEWELVCCNVAWLSLTLFLGQCQGECYDVS